MSKNIIKKFKNLKNMGWKWEFCKYGWKNNGVNTGECCCNCENQIKLKKHPWNKIYQGSMSEDSGLYACIAEHDMDDKREGTIFESKHGFCEFYVGKSLREKKIERILGNE